MSPLSFNQQFGTIMNKFFSHSSRESMADEAFTQSDDYSQFCREEAQALAKANNAKDKENDLLNFLDRIFKMALDEKESIELYPDIKFQMFEFTLFRECMTVDDYQLMADLNFDYNGHELQELIDRVVIESKKEGFDKDLWLNLIRQHANETNINETGVSDRNFALAGNGFPGLVKDPALKAEIFDLLIEKGADIFNGGKNDQPLVWYISIMPENLKYFLDNHPSLFADKEKVLESAANALLTFVKDAAKAFSDTDLFRQDYISDLNYIKQSFDYLRQAGFDLADTDCQITPAAALSVLAAMLPEDNEGGQMILQQVKEDLDL